MTSHLSSRSKNSHDGGKPYTFASKDHYGSCIEKKCRTSLSVSRESFALYDTPWEARHGFTMMKSNSRFAINRSFNMLRLLQKRHKVERYKQENMNTYTRDMKICLRWQRKREQLKVLLCKAVSATGREITHETNNFWLLCERLPEVFAKVLIVCIVNLCFLHVASASFWKLHPFPLYETILVCQGMMMKIIPAFHLAKASILVQQRKPHTTTSHAQQA